MNLCTCQPNDKKLTLEFLKSTDLTDWSLLSLQDMVSAGNTLEDLKQLIPFRSTLCNRTVGCCGECTRLCIHRCVQDCLHRIYVWRKLAETSPVPKAIHYAINQKFDTPEDLALVVGEIISAKTNTKVREYLNHEEISYADHPYKNDYASRIAVDPNTGKRIVNPDNGGFLVLKWPKTGLCPYCLPKSTIDRRRLKKHMDPMGNL